jgi:hypothetical protein
MKAIFAVSALAAAISAQALAADTEATTSFTGAMDAQVILDMESATIADSTYDVDLKEDDYNYGISFKFDVVNGPFSGSIGVKSDEGNTDFDIGDLVVTDGKLSFGQVGSFDATDGYVDGVVGMSDSTDDTKAVHIGSDVAFRYAVSDEMKVQLGGLNDDAGTAIIPAAQYMTESGALSFAVEGQVKLSAVGAELDMDPEIFAGAGVTYASDMVTVTAGLNYVSDTAGSDMEYAVNVSSTVAGATVGAGYYDPSSEGEKDEEAAVEVSYAIDAITPSAGYKYTTAEDAGDELWAKVAYAADSYNASAKVIMANFDGGDAAADPMIELRVDTTSEVGVTYYGEFDFQSDATNKLTVGAKYSF